MFAKARLYLNADKTRAVPEGRKDAAFLYAAIGDEIPQSAADRLGIVDGLVGKRADTALAELAKAWDDARTALQAAGDLAATVQGQLDALAPDADRSVLEGQLRDVEAAVLAAEAQIAALTPLPEPAATKPARVPKVGKPKAAKPAKAQKPGEDKEIKTGEDKGAGQQSGGAA